MTQATATTYTHRSFSQINQLRTCGEQYRLERIERVPSRPSCPAVAGTVVHTGTETVDQLLVEMNQDETKDQNWDDLRGYLILNGAADADVALDVEIEKYRKKGWEPETWRRYGRSTSEKPKGEDIEWFREHGIPLSIEAYVDWRLAHDDLVLAEVPDFGPAIEVPFNYYIGDQLVRGYIDRIFTSKTDGGYFPFDLKSGQKPKTSEQLGTYAAALRSALGWDIKWGYYIYALKTGKAKMTAPLMLEHWTDEKLGTVYLPANLAISQNIFIPSPGEACRHCGVTDHCTYFQAVV